MVDDKTKYDKLRKSILNDNKILFIMRNKPMSETCMCWGLEVSDAWLETIDELCKKLEALNYMYYQKFGVRIQADQVKEKFGGLRYYYSVVCDPPKFIRIYENIVGKLMHLMSKIDFRCKYVMIKPACDYVDKAILTKEECKEDIKYGIASNAKFILNDDRTYTKELKMYRTEIGKYVPTRFKIIHKFLSYKYKIHSFVRNLFKWESTYKQLCISQLLDELASKYIRDAEEKCENICERCGTQIGSDWSPRCTTMGWISHICKECADKIGENYSMNDEIWNSGKLVMTKEEYEKAQKEKYAEYSDCEDEESEDEE